MPDENWRPNLQRARQGKDLTAEGSITKSDIGGSGDQSDKISVDSEDSSVRRPAADSSCSGKAARRGRERSTGERLGLERRDPMGRGKSLH